MAKKKTKRKKKSVKSKDPMAWWREARFGLFIHWGLYAVTRGEWKGKETEGIGEWIMHREKIPLAEYRRLAARFYPCKFDAERWVQMAKDAGMKYIVITAKHHDGFAMYKSGASHYSIVATTPFNRDPMKELARACEQADIKLCFYYSQDQDWEDPNGTGNDWDYDEDKKDFATYLERKVKPQLRELLKEYGPIGLIWFDTPMKITPEQSQELAAYVHKLQKKCLVSGRVGHGAGDYGSMGDNEIPVTCVPGDWEVPATMNHTWGYKKGDYHWKSAKTLIQLLVQLASRGVNYLLNVGPTDTGIIPSPSLTRLKEIGAWMEVNGEAIHGTTASPYPYEFDWGYITQKEEMLYLLLVEWPRKIVLPGLRSKVDAAYLLRDREHPLTVEQEHDEASDTHTLTLKLPHYRPDKHCSVIALELADEIDVDATLAQMPGGRINLFPTVAERRSNNEEPGLTIGRRGQTEHWTSQADWLRWDVNVTRPLKFRVVVAAAPAGWKDWVEGNEVSVTVGDARVSGALTRETPSEEKRAIHHDEYANDLGFVEIKEAGTHTIELRADKINPDAPGGITVLAVDLLPVHDRGR